MRKRVQLFVIIGAVLGAFLLGCGGRQEKKVIGRCIYYVNAEKTGLKKVAYKEKFSDPGKEVEDILTHMQETPESLEYLAPIPEGIEIRGISGMTAQYKALVLDFSSNYKDLDPVTEVLLREAVVRTMVQVEGVEAVAITVDKQPLVDKYGKEIGEMSESTFLKNTGSAIHSYKKVSLTLYFANEAGDHLKKQEMTTRYNSNMMMEKLVLEQLKKGPSDKKMKATLPKDVKVLSVSLKDGICYVNLGEQFLNAAYEVQPEIVVASIVNSIIDAGNASQVQISVNGENNISFQGKVSLERPFTRDLDIVE